MLKISDFGSQKNDIVKAFKAYSKDIKEKMCFDTLEILFKAFFILKYRD